MNEQPAEFPGGETAWREYLGNNLKYPDSLKNIKGQVILKFIVNPKGTVERVEIIKSLHPLLDKEAIRVIRLLQSGDLQNKTAKKFRQQRHNPLISVRQKA